MSKAIYLALLTCFSLSVNAQYIRSPWSYGIYGGMQQSIFTGQFKELPRMDNCCSGFSGTSHQLDPFFGISIEHALNKNFTIGLSLDYVKARGAYSAINTIGHALSFKHNPNIAYHLLYLQLESLRQWHGDHSNRVLE